MFRHMVMWRLDSDDPKDRQAMRDRIREVMGPLPELVPSIRRMVFHENAILPEENADLVLVMDFDDRRGFDEYRDHPAHRACTPVIAPLYRTRLAVDDDGVDAGRGLQGVGSSERPSAQQE